MSSDRVLPVLLRRGGGRANDLGRMTLRELVIAYLTYPAIILYAVLFLLCVGAALWLGALQSPLKTLLAIAGGVAVYPFYEYAVHRYLLHNRILYRFRFTAGLWKRIHYDHHQDPNRLDVLFGAPSNTLLAIFGPSLPLGWIIGGPGAAFAVAATAVALFAFYEFCHCVQHLNITPKSAWLRRIKKHHMAHHFHNETGNFGITTTFVDRLVGTCYEDRAARPRSSHVYDLGYDAEEASRYPWVAARSEPRRDPASAP